MLYIMKKDAKAFMFNLFIIIPLALYWLISKDRLDVLMVLIQGITLTLLVVTPIMVNEQYEEKHRGYRFMRTLPIRKIEIIGAKFIAVLTAAAVLVVFNCLLFSFFDGSPGMKSISRSFILLSGISGIILAALVYLGVFILGYTKFVMIFPPVVFFLAMLPPLITKYYRPQVDALFAKIIDFVKNLDWAAAVIVSLVLYFSLMVLAVKLQREKV